MARNFRAFSEPPPPIPTIKVVGGEIVGGLEPETDQTADYWKCVADRLRIKLEESKAANRRNRKLKVQFQKKLEKYEKRRESKQVKVDRTAEMADDYHEME